MQVLPGLAGLTCWMHRCWPASSSSNSHVGLAEMQHLHQRPRVTKVLQQAPCLVPNVAAVWVCSGRRRPHAGYAF